MNDKAVTSKRQACITFDVDAEAPILAIDPEHADNAMAMTHQAFGPLVGVPRTIRLLADYDIKSTFVVPGVTAIRYPGAVELILEAGHEVAHNTHRHVSALEWSRCGPDASRCACAGKEHSWLRAGQARSAGSYRLNSLGGRDQGGAFSRARSSLTSPHQSRALLEPAHGVAALCEL